MRSAITKTADKPKKINWRKGSAELLGIALVLPVLCVIIFMIIGIMQSGVLRQTIEHTTYMAARAAATCDNMIDAQAQATSTARMTLSESAFGVDADDIIVNLQLVGGTSGTNTATNGSTNGITWEKGALLKCQVIMTYDSLTSFDKATMESTVYVMVERPARTYY